MSFKSPPVYRMDNSTLLGLANLTTSVLPEPAKADECGARSHEDPAVRGREAERLPGQEPAGAAARAESADSQGSIFRHFGVQSPK